MQKIIFPFCLLLLAGCENSSISNVEAIPLVKTPKISSNVYDKNSWPYFLQHLPEVNKPILDYKGNPIEFQQKHTAILTFDVGNRDLQQCADALMRLRAEYLFSQNRYNEIGFHFVSGQYYTWMQYCKGVRSKSAGNKVVFIKENPCRQTHETLRKYLDIVYNYASTISLAKELKPTNNFEIGTVIIHPGSPGHCFIISDEAINSSGEKVFKLVEGYTPAQSIYVLRNPEAIGNSPWYPLKKGIITTASCKFINYQMGKFE